MTPAARTRLRPGFLALALALSTASSTLFAAETALESPEETFKRALFAEEGRRDFDAAIRDYERLVRGMDDQRRLAATALFRLGECYRKQRRTNDAVAQFRRVTLEFPQEDTLVQLSRQNLLSLGAEPPRDRAAIPAPDSRGSDATPGVANAAPDASRPEQLAAQLAAIRRWNKDPVRQAKAVQSLFPDATLDQLLTRLTVLQRNAETLAQRTKDDWPRNGLAGDKILEAGPDAIVTYLHQFPPMESTPTQVQAKEIERHLRYLAARIEHVLGLQEARLDILRAATPVAEAPADGLGRLEQELALLESQCDALRALDSRVLPQTLVSLFPAEAQGIARLQAQRDDLQIQEARLAATLADEHPDRVALRRVLLTLDKKLDQETHDVRASLETRRDTLRATCLRLRRSAPASQPPDLSNASLPSTQEEQEEIRRIQTLVAHSPDLINTTKDNSSPLIAAAAKGQLAVARYLLDHGAKPVLGSTTTTPLHAAVAAGHKAMTELLLERGSPADVRNSEGKTPLFLAAQSGFLGIAEVLLKHGANPNLPAPRRPNSGERSPQVGSPLNPAVAGDRLDLVHALLDHGADPNLRDEGKDMPPGVGNPPLRFARSIEALNLLLSRGADPNLPFRDGTSRLYWAAVEADLDLVDALLKAGARPDGPLHAVDTVVTPLTAAVTIRRRDIAERLATNGASINALNGGYGPLHAALAKADLEWVRWVLDHGANPGLALAGGVTPLQIALGCDDHRHAAQHPDLFTGNLPGFEPSLPGGFSVRSDTTFQLTVAGTGDPNSPVAFAPYRLGAFVRLLLEHGADPNHPFSDGSRLVHHLAAREMAAEDWNEFLTKFKADANARTSRDVTPLMVAICRGASDSFEALLRAGADVHAQDAIGNTALHFATQNQSVFFVGKLIDAKAGPSVTNRFGTTPADLAIQGWTHLNAGPFDVYVPTPDSLPRGDFQGTFHQRLRSILGALPQSRERLRLLGLLGVSIEPPAPSPGSAPITAPTNPGKD